MGVPPCIIRQFHCQKYRRYIIGKLLHYGKSNDEIICDLPFCSKPFGKKMRWLQCNVCNRWFHSVCVNVTKTPANYKCLFCVE